MRDLGYEEYQSFKLPPEHKAALKRVAHRQETTVGELLRGAVEVLIAPDTFQYEREPERRNPFIERARRAA
jgi:hypothetical protein